MESGGVVAAARAFRGHALPIFQIRAVSDMADPAKSDTEWRKRGVQTIAHLVSRIDWERVLGS
jgi:nucleoside phosphorylase